MSKYTHGNTLVYTFLSFSLYKCLHMCSYEFTPLSIAQRTNILNMYGLKSLFTLLLYLPLSLSVCLSVCLSLSIYILINSKLCAYLYNNLHSQQRSKTHTHTHTHTNSLTHSLTVCLSITLSLSLYIYIYIYTYSAKYKQAKVNIYAFISELTLSHWFDWGYVISLTQIEALIDSGLERLATLKSCDTTKQFVCGGHIYIYICMCVCVCVCVWELHKIKYNLKIETIVFDINPGNCLFLIIIKSKWKYMFDNHRDSIENLSGTALTH